MLVLACGGVQPPEILCTIKTLALKNVFTIAPGAYTGVPADWMDDSDYEEDKPFTVQTPAQEAKPKKHVVPRSKKKAAKGQQEQAPEAFCCKEEGRDQEKGLQSCQKINQ